MTDFLIKAAQLLLSLSILVTLHELGHFVPARLFGIRVKKFYLFFDFLFPLPNVWNFSIFKFKKGETEYGLGWFPMGGYVQIDGMIDESMDTEAMKKPPQPWEFRSKLAWQRLIVMVGGVVVNLILGFLIYSMVLYAWGKQRVPLENMTYGVHVHEVLHPYGLQDGDKILSVGDTSVRYFDQLGMSVLINQQREITIERNGQQQIIQLPDSIEQVVLASGARGLFGERIPFVVDSIIKDSPAEKAGLAAGDTILKVGDTDAYWVHAGRQALKDHADSTIALVVGRNGQDVELQVSVTEQGTLGFGYKGVSDFLETETFKYTFWESIPAGFRETGQKLGGYISSLRLLFSKEGVSQIGGFGAIGGMFPSVWDWHSFWTMTAFLSLILAFMNILPIPALDGGHVLFLLVEMVTGRKPGDRFLEIAQTIGMIILLALLVLANGNDIVKWVSTWFE